MAATHKGRWWHLLSAAGLIVSGCLSVGTISSDWAGPPVSPVASTVPPQGQTTVPPLPAAGVPVLTGAVSLSGRPLAGAAVTVARVVDAQTVATGGVTDAQGTFRVAMPVGLATDTLLLIVASTPAATLFGVTTPAAGMTIQQLATPVSLDVASTIVVKRVLPKLAEAVISQSGTPAGRQRLADLRTQLAALQQAVAVDLGGPPRDARLQQALTDWQQQADDLRIDALANAVVAYGDSQGRFVGIIEDGHQAYVDNLVEGGAPLPCRPWRVGGTTAAMPQLSILGDRQVQIVYRGQTVTASLAVDRLSEPSSVIAWLERLLHNDLSPPLPVPGTGGGGGAPPPPPPPPIDLNTAVTIADGAALPVIGTVMAHYVNTSNTDGFIGDGGPALNGRLFGANDITVDRAGNLYIADTYNLRVRRVDRLTKTITTIAGSGATGSSSNAGSFSGDGGLATAAQLTWTGGMTFDRAGNLYVADIAARRVRKINASDGKISTVAGSGATTNATTIKICGLLPGSCSLTSSGDGQLATSAVLSTPGGLACDAADNLYIVDALTHRIRRVDAQTKIITTIAGTGAAGSTGDNGAATLAKLNTPAAIAYSPRENALYVSEYVGHRVRRIALDTGIITTVVGNGTAASTGDGRLATAAQVKGPAGLALDAAGNLFVVEKDGTRVRRIDAVTGKISLFAGTGNFVDNVPPTMVDLRGPAGIAIDPWGAIFLTDKATASVRIVQ